MKLTSFAVVIVALVESVQADMKSFNIKPMAKEDLPDFAEPLMRPINLTPVDIKNKSKPNTKGDETIPLNVEPVFQPINLTPVSEDQIREDLEKLKRPKIGQGQPRTIEDLQKMLDEKLGDGRKLEDLSRLPTIEMKTIDKFETMISKGED